MSELCSPAPGVRGLRAPAPDTHGLRAPAEAVLGVGTDQGQGRGGVLWEACRSQEGGIEAASLSPGRRLSFPMEAGPRGRVRPQRQVLARPLEGSNVLRAFLEKEWRPGDHGLMTAEGQGQRVFFLTAPLSLSPFPHKPLKQRSLCVCVCPWGRREVAAEGPALHKAQEQEP